MVDFTGIHLSGDFTGKQPVIVLCHSSLSSAKQWWFLTALAKQNYRIINMDLLGYGHAPAVSAPVHYSFADEVERLDSVLHKYNIKSYHLVGHSFGAALALKIATHKPSSIESLSLFEPVAFHLFDHSTVEYESAVNFAQNVLTNEPYKAAELFTNYWNKVGFFVGLPQKMQDLMAKDMPKVNLDFQALMAEKYTLSDVSKIDARVLLMKGGQSTHLAHEIINFLLKSLPHAKIIEFDAGHMAPVSHAEQVQSEIFKFIECC